VFNWASYNELLVRRAEIILDFGIIDGWYDELERMNQGKRGAACGYHDSFVQLLGYVKAYFHLPYRQTEGVVRAHAANILTLKCGVNRCLACHSVAALGCRSVVARYPVRLSYPLHS
jgi:hypothetical protein